MLGLAGLVAFLGGLGRFDSYDSTIGNYNPVNVSTSTNLPNTFDRGNLNFMADGVFDNMPVDEVAPLLMLPIGLALRSAA